MLTQAALTQNRIRSVTPFNPAKLATALPRQDMRLRHSTSWAAR